MTRPQRYYHFYELPKPLKKARRRNIDSVSSAKEARKVREYYNQMGMPTGVFVNRERQSPELLPWGEKLWLEGRD